MLNDSRELVLPGPHLEKIPVAARQHVPSLAIWHQMGRQGTTPLAMQRTLGEMIFLGGTPTDKPRRYPEGPMKELNSATVRNQKFQKSLCECRCFTLLLQMFSNV